jgi:thiamine transport system ATP-binding protein
MTGPALRVRSLSVAYDGVPAVADASFDVADGQVLAVLGPSGCGKSTLLRAVAGLEQAAGSVAWHGTDLSRTPTHKRGFALMFQDGQLFPQLTVAANVGYPLRIRRTPGRAERVSGLLDLVGLSDLADRYPATLSEPWPPPRDCSCSTSLSALWTPASGSAWPRTCAGSSSPPGRPR